MKCPKCDTKMDVINTYAVPGGNTQKWQCVCRTVVVVANVAVILAVDPEHGQGAASMAKRLEGKIERLKKTIKDAV